jgi:S1-C subfamily serine protease
MFIPIDRLGPVLDDLVAMGRSSEPPRPWLGVFTEEYRGRIFVTDLAPEGPPDQAGLKPGDIILKVDGKAVKGQADFYRKICAKGRARVDISLNILQGAQIRDLKVHSSDRNQYFHLRPSSKGKTLAEGARLARETLS